MAKRSIYLTDEEIECLLYTIDILKTDYQEADKPYNKTKELNKAENKLIKELHRR